MTEKETQLTVVGGGLAGCEAAWQAAECGLRVTLYEMRPEKSTGAHRTDRLAELAVAKGISSAQLALAWLLAQPGEILPIPGTRRVARIAENAAAADITLSTEEVATLSTLFSPDAVAGARYPEAGWVGIERG